MHWEVCVHSQCHHVYVADGGLSHYYRGIVHQTQHKSMGYYIWNEECSGIPPCNIYTVFSHHFSLISCRQQDLCQAIWGGARCSSYQLWGSNAGTTTYELEPGPYEKKSHNYQRKFTSQCHLPISTVFLAQLIRYMTCTVLICVCFIQINVYTPVISNRICNFLNCPLSTVIWSNRWEYLGRKDFYT